MNIPDCFWLLVWLRKPTKSITRYLEEGKPRARGGKDPLATPMGGVSRSKYLVCILLNSQNASGA